MSWQLWLSVFGVIGGLSMPIVVLWQARENKRAKENEGDHTLTATVDAHGQEIQAIKAQLAELKRTNDTLTRLMTDTREMMIERFARLESALERIK